MMKNFSQIPFGHRGSSRGWKPCLTLILAWLLIPLALPAATRTWTGGYFSGYWSAAANWAGNAAPQTGDDLVFPPGAAHLANTNNLGSRTFRSITISGSGYTLRNSSPTSVITLTAGLRATYTTGTSTVEIPLRLEGSQTYECRFSTATLDVPSDIDLGSHALTVLGAGSTRLGGVISGAGGITKTGSGTLQIYGPSANTYTGPTRVNSGLLELNKVTANAMAGDLVVGDGAGADSARWLRCCQLPSSSDITVNDGAVLDLNNFNDGVGGLTLNGGHVQAGNPVILGGNVTAQRGAGGPATISGRLSLGSALRTFQCNWNGGSPALRIDAEVSGTGGIRLVGDAGLELLSSNSYSGLTIVAQNHLVIENALALGTASSGTVVSNGASLILDIDGLIVPDEPLTLHGPGDGSSGALWTANATHGTWNGALTLAGDTEIGVVGVTGQLTLGGAISGPGGLTKVYDGTLILSGNTANTYAGQTWVADGVLEMAKTSGNAVPHELVIGTDSGVEQSVIARNRRSAQCDRVTVNATGLYDVNGFTEVVSALTLNGGGDVDTGSGLLRLVGDLEVDPQGPDAPRAEISGRMELGGSGTRTLHVLNSTTSGGGDLFELRISAVISGAPDLLKTGAGTVWLTGANTFTGELTIDEGIVNVSHSQGFGSTSGGVVVNNNSTLLISSVTVGNEALVLNSTGTPGWTALDARLSCSWAGPITLQRDTRIYVRYDTFEISGPISGTGNLTKYAGVLSGTLIFSGSEPNTYAGTTYVQGGELVLDKSTPNGAIPGDLVVGDGTGGSEADVVRLQRGTQIANDAEVTIASSGLLDQAGHGEAFDTLVGSGTLDLGGGYLNLGLENGTASFDGVIRGSGGRISKQGTGTQTFNGDNTYTGATTVEAGTLIVNGAQPDSAVVVRSGATLGGTGRTGLINAQGTVSPGVSPGQLTGADLNFQSGSTLLVELFSPQPGTGYDQLRALGSVELNSPVLSLQAHPPFAPGDRFTIIDNDGSDAISGQFLGLPDGSERWAGGHRLRIQYDGGDGNDVALTVEGTALELVGPQVLWGDGDGVIEPNECNLLYFGLTNAFPETLTGVSATLSTTTPGARITQDTSLYPDIPAGGVATNMLPFQLSTGPDLPCGAAIDLMLSVQTSEGNLRLPLTLTTGRIGRPVRYDSEKPVLIPDVGEARSPVTVKDYEGGPLAWVEVSCFIRHPRVGDLGLFLVAPDGREIELSTGNGRLGRNYGISCDDRDRTVFADNATVPIAVAVAPFVGRFRPERPLADLAGLTDPNGEWTLRVADRTELSEGTLECWSLLLAPRECASSSGPCELCSADITLAGTLAGAPVQDGALQMNGQASSCTLLKPCPALQDTLLHPYAAYTFVNGAREACITVRLHSDCDVSFYSAAYLGTFNPADPCENYLGDAGSAGNRTWSFAAPADATFVVVVSALLPPAGCADYTLAVSGGDCQPVLHIQPATGNRVTLNWTSAAVGYHLEDTPALDPTDFQPVPAAPVVHNGQCTVTVPAPETSRFYRLEKSGLP